MFLNTYSELRRLRKRVVALETRLEDELTRHLAREDALVNLVTTAHGHRGISEPSVEPKKPAKPVSETRVLSAEDEATRNYYVQCARSAGLSDDVAEGWFQSYLRGEEPVMGMEN